MRRLMFALAVLSVLVFSGAAQAEPYISGYLGAAFPHDADVSNNTGFGGGTGTVEFDTGLALGAKAGYWFTDQGSPFFGLQVDVNGHYPSTSSLSSAGITFDWEADVSVISYTANVLLRMPEGNIRPYVGIGAGWFTAEIDDSTITILGFSIPFQGAEDTAFGWQVLAGVDFLVNPNFSLFGEYKYSTADFKFGGGVGLDVEYGVSQVYGGVSYHF